MRSITWGENPTGEKNGRMEELWKLDSWGKRKKGRILWTQLRGVALIYILLYWNIFATHGRKNIMCTYQPCRVREGQKCRGVGFRSSHFHYSVFSHASSGTHNSSIITFLRFSPLSGFHLWWWFFYKTILMHCVQQRNNCVSSAFNNFAECL